MKNLYLFRTTGGMPILATVEDFMKHWHQYIMDRGEAYTWELFKGDLS